MMPNWLLDAAPFLLIGCIILAFIGVMWTIIAPVKGPDK